MQRFLHGMFAMVLFAGATCTMAHAEMPMEELPVSSCPYHKQQDAPQKADHYNTCLTTHFVGASKILPDFDAIAVLALLPGPVGREEATTELLLASLHPIFEDLFLRHHSIRI